MEKDKWLNEEPEQKRLVELHDGIFIIPYDEVQCMLELLTENTYSTVNFHYSYNMVNDEPGISSSIEVKVNYLTKPGRVERTLTGASNHTLRFIKELATIAGTDLQPNESYVATSKSLSIVNAVKPLGRKFGRYLNLPTQNN
jgi:hypothetical protein